jgi:hypothetical protein
MSDWLSW